MTFTSSYFLCISPLALGHFDSLIIIPQHVLITLKLSKLKPDMIFELERDQFRCKIWRWRFWSTICLFMPMIWGLLSISLNCLAVLNTLKVVWLLSKMISGALGPRLYQIVKIRMLTFLLAYTRWQFAEYRWKYEDFQHWKPCILLHFALTKKLMQIKTYLTTNSMMLIIAYAG